MSTPALLVYRILVTASSTLAFLCCLLFICRVWCLVDFCFLASAALSILFCFVFLNNRWLDIVNESKPFDFACLHRHCCCGLLTLSHVTASSTFAFATFSSSVAWAFDRFPLFSSAFSILCFASSFLTTVGCTLLIESTPFVFAVSTPALFVTVYRILSCCYCFINLLFFCLLFICRIGCLIDFRFLASAALSMLLLLRLS